MLRRTPGVLAALVALLVFAPLAHAREPQQGTFVFDGWVSAIQPGPDGSTYVGGDFAHEQTVTGGGLIVNATGGGTPDPGAFPTVAGSVRAVVADGAGGWYVGGDFERIGSRRIRNLAHITRDGAVDPAFTPNPD